MILLIIKRQIQKTLFVLKDSIDQRNYIFIVNPFLHFFNALVYHFFINHKIHQNHLIICFFPQIFHCLIFLLNNTISLLIQKNIFHNLIIFFMFFFLICFVSMFNVLREYNCVFVHNLFCVKKQNVNFDRH